jgi:hypothetical protein
MEAMRGVGAEVLTDSVIDMNISLTVIRPETASESFEGRRLNESVIPRVLPARRVVA